MKRKVPSQEFFVPNQNARFLHVDIENLSESARDLEDIGGVE